MKIVIKQELNLSADLAWNAVGERFGDNGQWTSLLTSSHLTGELKEGVERVCLNKNQKTVEKLSHFCPNKMELTYHITSKLPPIIRHAKNYWTVRSLGENRSLVTSHVTTELVWWAKWLTPLMYYFIDKVVNIAMEELKHWAETGEPHPRKKAHNVKYSKFIQGSHKSVISD